MSTTIDTTTIDTTTVDSLRQPSPRQGVPLLPTVQLRKRNRYIDALHALALVMVMTYHVFGWAWLPIVFPSIGVMFALAGSLVAGSLDRSPGNPWRVLKARTTRLLPPVWLFGLIVVPVMLVAGWTHSETAGVPLSWQTMLFWILPISDPPASSFGDDWVSPLWYFRAYLWFLLLSPAALWLFRHWPKRMLALPLSVVVLSAVGLLPLEGRSGDVILALAMFGGCWMLGFAHHDKKLQSLPLVGALLGGALLMALGLTWAFTHLDPVTAYDLATIPMANTLYSLGAVLILLRLQPDLSWMEKRVVLDKVLTVINSRAMTIYMYANIAIFLSNPILGWWSVTAALDGPDLVGSVLMYLASWLALIIFVFLFGWCEDLAARKPLRINPWPRSKEQLATMRTRRVLTFPHPAWMADLTPKRLFIVTACLVGSASGLSAVALAGTDTPGRTTIADAPSRSAVNPRADTRPPINLGQGHREAAILQLPSLGAALPAGPAITPRPLFVPTAPPAGSNAPTGPVPQAPVKPGPTTAPLFPAPKPSGGATPAPTTAPTSEPTSEPTTEPTSEPTSEPTTEPTSEPTSEPTTEPTSEPTSGLPLP